jgi:hypothetical protein
MAQDTFDTVEQSDIIQVAVYIPQHHSAVTHPLSSTNHHHVLEAAPTLAHHTLRVHCAYTAPTTGRITSRQSN